MKKPPRCSTRRPRGAAGKEGGLETVGRPGEQRVCPLGYADPAAQNWHTGASAVPVPVVINAMGSAGGYRPGGAGG